MRRDYPWISQSPTQLTCMETPASNFKAGFLGFSGERIDYGNSVATLRGDVMQMHKIIELPDYSELLKTFSVDVWSTPRLL